MATYDEKQEKAFNEIADTLFKLDNTLATLANTDSKVKHFFEQEKALHEINKIVRETKKIEKLEDEKIDSVILTAEEIAQIVDDNLKSIGKTLVNLDDTLAKLDDAEGSKVKSYILQKKAIHEVKKILNKIGFYDDYDETEIIE